VIRERGAAEIQVIGAGALNQAIKAIAIARGFLTPVDIDLVCIPSFTEVSIDGEARTAIRLALQDRHAVLTPDEASVTTTQPDDASLQIHSEA
jgi:stage V sporulation protein S